jgi:chorismate synthase
MNNSFGKLFSISIFGESHGKAVGIVIDGCPAGIDLLQKDFLDDLIRRQGEIKGTTERKEKDVPQIISGVFNNKTSGSPITILFSNKDIKSKDYEDIKDTPRPSHVDFVANKKFNDFNDYRGGGYFSGRLTVALVAAGVVAKKIINLDKNQNIIINANLEKAGGIKDINKAIDTAIKTNDSIGGIVKCAVINLPIGLGEPFFNSVESLISHAVFSIPGIKGIEFGSGFNAARMNGSQHNDTIIDTKGTTSTNNAGGINGGITNGNELVFRVAVKPTSSIAKTQNTINLNSGNIEKLNIKGRHDVCIALRMPVIVESATAIVLADLLLQG